MTIKTRLTLKSALIGAGLVVAAMAGTSTSAQAEGFSFGFSIGNGDNRIHSRHYSNRHGRHILAPRSHVTRRHACSPRRALRKARRLGVHRAYIRRVSHRGIVVGGRFEGDRVKVRFNNRCRVARVRYR